MSQIINRKIEEDNSLSIVEVADNIQNQIMPKYTHCSGPVLKSFQNCLQFKQVHFESFILKCTEGDNCCFLKDKSIVYIRNFVKKDQNLFLIGKKYQTIEDF